MYAYLCKFNPIYYNTQPGFVLFYFSYPIFTRNETTRKIDRQTETGRKKGLMEWIILYFIGFDFDSFFRLMQSRSQALGVIFELSDAKTVQKSNTKYIANLSS